MKNSETTFGACHQQGQHPHHALLSALALGEPFTARMGIGAALILAGLVVLAGK